MSDQRAAPRRKVELSGRLILADGTGALECVIVDVSDVGAHVRTELSLVLPERVYLWQGDTADIYDCEVRWQSGNQAGLYIVDTCGRQMRRALIGISAPDHRSRVRRWLGEL